MSPGLPDRPPERVLAAPDASPARYPDHEGYVERDGVRVFYEVYGDREPTILLVPAWGSPARAWKAQIAYLARHFRVIALDQRGTGRSSRPRGAAAYALREHVADTLAVLDATDTASAVLVGNTRAVQTALGLAAEHPERVRALAAIAPFVPLTPWPPVDEIWRLFEQPQPWRRRLTALGGLLRGATLLLRMPALRRLARRAGPTRGAVMFSRQQMRDDFEAFVDWFLDVFGDDPHSTRQLEDLRGWWRTTGAEAMADAWMGDCLRTPEAARALCARVSCPLLVIHGDRDLASPPEWGEALAEAADGELRVIEGAGHILGGRYPVAVNLALRDFFDSVVTTTAQPTAGARGAAPALATNPRGAR